MEPLTSRVRAELGLPFGIPNLGAPTHQVVLSPDGTADLVPADHRRLLSGDFLPGDPGQPFLVGADGESLHWPIHPSERDAVSDTMGALGSRWRPAMQALHDVATGRARRRTRPSCSCATSSICPSCTTTSSTRRSRSRSRSSTGSPTAAVGA